MTTPWQPGFQGTTVVPPGYNDPHNWSPAAALQLVAGTGSAGFALQNATPTIMSWTAPADGQMHRVFVEFYELVTSPTTGGSVQVAFTDPSGAAQTVVLNAGTQAAGPKGASSNPGFPVIPVAPGSTFSLVQNSAMTAGAAKVWAEFWAS